MPKLITRIFGGIGNQLFIYATSKALAMRTGAELVLDTQTGFRHDVYQRQFTLHCFDIQYKEANAFERFDFPAGRAVRFALRRANQYLLLWYRFYLTDMTGNNRRFMPELMSYKPAFHTWMEGYWQSPRYFEDIRETLQKELTIQCRLSPETLRVAGDIRKANSVCVHLRLSRNLVSGDVKTSGKQLDWEYFARSMDFVAQKIENPSFFCFSDNPRAAALVQSLPYDITLIGHNKGDEHAHEDFYLMSLCRHFILSNSTFGWWPAWLNTEPANIVISPSLHYWDNRDILPSRWTVFDNIRNTFADAL